MKVIRASGKDWIDGKGYRKRVLAEGEDLPLRGMLIQEVTFNEGESIPPHYHRSQTEIFYVLGKGAITISGKDIKVEKGDVVVCEPGEIHSIPEIEQNFSFLVMKLNYVENDSFWL